MNKKEIQTEADKYQWFHKYEIVPGVMSNGVSDMAARTHYFPIPEDLSGKRVLDIGCADGYFSFLAESRGATVVSIDSWPRQGFFVTHRARNSKVEFHHMNVQDIHPDKFGLFDIVLFFGVYYHLKHPILAVERIANVTRGYALIESEITPLIEFSNTLRGKIAKRLAARLPQLPPGVGVSRFYEQDTLGGDPTNWWVPDMDTFKRTIRGAGFPQVEVVTRYHRTRGIVRANKGPRTAGKILNEDFFVHLEKISAPIPQNSSVNLEGWALSQLEPDGGIDHIYLYLDKLDDPDNLIGTATYPLSSPDVTRHFIDAYKTSGFQFKWDTTGISLGKHILYVLADGKRGWHYRAMTIEIV
ncbi:MAG: methyltransferase domain-containing protein [Chloroflexi bacterium]|nr:methyltransferase domain-containing protein [Chloroflexota bacterium]